MGGVSKVSLQSPWFMDTWHHIPDLVCGAGSDVENSAGTVLLGWMGRGGEVDKEGKCSQRETESKISHDSQPLVFTAARGSPPLEHSRDLLPAKRLWQRGRDFIDGIKVPSADLALIKRRGSQLSLTLSGELSILGTEAVPCWFGEVSCQSEPADEEGRVPRACGSWDRFGLSWSWGAGSWTRVDRVSGKLQGGLLLK